MYGNTYYVTKYKVLYTTGNKLQNYASFVDTKRKNPYTVGALVVYNYTSLSEVGYNDNDNKITVTKCIKM